MASWGYVVFASQYRGNDGGEGEDELGGADVDDVVNLMPLAEEFIFADNSSWGIEGWSRGGMMTFLTLQRNSNFKCAVLSGAISDLKAWVDINEKTKNNFREHFGELDYKQRLINRSAIFFAESLPKIPYLIMHGGNDDTVLPVQSIKLSQKLSSLNIPYRLIIFEGGGHFLKNHRAEVDQQRRVWYNKYLKGEK